MGFEDHIQNSMFRNNSEKTFIDKILAKDEVDKIREIIKKANLAREDILEILYLLSGVESKLVNYSSYDRYVILKFFVWLREFVKIYEILFDYEDDLKKRQKTLDEQGKEKKVITPRCRQLLDNNKRLLEHNIKFLLDLYVNISRTTLSIGATGLIEILKNKFEISYPQQNPLTPQNNMNGVIRQ